MTEPRAMILGMRKCSACQYWMQLEEAGGLCRRFPPVPMVVGMGQKQTVLHNKPQPVEPIIMPFFPRTGAEDTCGEFAMKLEGSA